MLVEVGRPVGLWMDLCPIFSDTNKCDFAETVEPIFRVIFTVLILHQVLIEIFQARKDGWMYFSQTPNKVDICSLLMNFISVVLVWSGQVELNKIRIIASMGVVALWI